MKRASETTPLLSVPEESSSRLAEEMQRYRSPQRVASVMTHASSNAESDRSTPPLVVHDQAPETVPWSTKVRYYFPISVWLPSYTGYDFLCDLISGLSLASYQIPLSMSFASAMAHVPPICGLLGLSIAPMVYSLFGTVPQMIVGPEAATSLVVGQAIESVVKHSKGIDPVDVLSIVTFVSGCTLLGSGLARFGFLDNVLCGALLRGFVTGIGIVMEINSFTGMLGLTKLVAELPPDVHLHSPYNKFMFLVENIEKYDKLTAVLGLSSFVAIFTLRKLKKILVHRGVKSAVFFPEILFVVILYTLLATFEELPGVEVVGKIHVGKFKFRSPIHDKFREVSNQLLSTGVTAAVLGFFESTTAAKALGSNTGTTVSSNRELVALGMVGLAVSLVGALPSFGGYGRSKMNALTGAKTCFSGALMGVVTMLVTHYVLDYLENLPKCVLSAIIGVVGVSLLDEAPKDLLFHYRARGWNELITFAVTALATFFYSVELGIFLGCIYSVIRVIKHSAQSRIQILAREQDSNTFVNADENVAPDAYKITIQGLQPKAAKLEEVEGCLIVKIPEPLTFTNAADLKTRLLRIELYGSTKVHPGVARHREETMNRNIIFDLHGMTDLDSSASQILSEIIENYQRKGRNVFFCRVPHLSDVRERLANSGIKDLLEKNGSLLFSSVDLEDGPYYEDITDAIKAVDDIEQTGYSDIMSSYSSYAF